VKLPDASAVVVALDVPDKLTVAPVLVAETFPEMLKVGIAVAVKLMPVTFAPFTVAGALVGLNV
jgi:hypothetical protein